MEKSNETSKKTLAISSLVCALIGGYFSTVSIIAIVLGHIAMHKIKKDPQQFSGKGFAIAGLILGYLGLAIGLVIGVIRGMVKNELGY